MESKGKSGAVGGARRKQTKRRSRRNTKGVVSAIAEYLISDSYLYAPLIDPHHHPPADEIRSPPPASYHGKKHGTVVRPLPELQLWSMQQEDC